MNSRMRTLSKTESPLCWRRLRAVAVLRFGTVDAFYKRMPVCPRSVQNQINRGRLSDSVVAAMIDALGQDAWLFVTKNSDTLRDELGSNAAA